MARLAVLLPVALLLTVAGCGGDDDDSAEPAESEVFTFRERMLTIDDAVAVWSAADSIELAQAAAEAAANLVVGPGGPGYGDRDGNGTVDGDATFGVLPGLDGTPPGLAEPLATNECIDADVLGGSWGDPAARWSALTDAVDAWSPDDNTMTMLASNPMRIVGWANLTLATDSLDEAGQFGVRAQTNVTVSLNAIDC